MARILVVDDDESMRTLLAVSLESAGHAVLVANNGREALQRCRETAIDLAITDMMMPEMDGLELIAALKESRGDLPIIAISGGSVDSPSYLQRAKDLGAAGIMEKPFKIRALLHAVDQVVHQIKA